MSDATHRGSGGAEESSEARRCSCGRAEDEPPPYASVIGDSEPVPWSYAFPGVAGYEPAGDNRTIARPLVSIPLTSYGIFKIEPPCYAAATQQQQQQLLPHPRIVTESGPPPKVFTESSRKYNGFLIAATLIISVMALSLLVRVVTDKSFWKR